MTDVDRLAIRVGVSQDSISFGTLAREFKRAELVEVSSLKVAIEMLTQCKIDAFASNKAILNEMSDEMPGSRMLAGRFGLVQVALGIPKGRDQGMVYLRGFAADMMSGGLLQRADETAGLHGTVKPNPD